MLVEYQKYDFQSDQGQLYMWGRGRDGQLGRGDQIESVASYHADPLLVSFFSQRSLSVRQVALGSDHSVAVTW